MVAKKRPTHPRIFSDVLQAIADLRDAKGSTKKKITEQVQIALSFSKVQPSARNIAINVQRALKHGVNSGVLKRTSGKYKLTFGGDAFGAYDEDDDVQGDKYRICGKGSVAINAKRKRKSVRKSQRKPSGRTRERRPKTTYLSNGPLLEGSSSEGGKSRNRVPTGGGARKSRSGSCYRSSASSRSSSAFNNRDEVRIVGRPKRSVWSIAKLKKINKPTARSKKPRKAREGFGRRMRRPKRLQRKKSPEPTDRNAGRGSDDVDAEIDEEQQQKNNEPERPGGNNEQYEQQENVSYNYIQARDVEGPECDNPDCLCNLKQEPDEDSAFENDGPTYM